MAYTTINKSSLNFNTKLYAGNGGTQSITGVGFKPDLVWTKQRTDAADHRLYDIVRGVYKQIASNTSADEESSNNTLTAFGSDGFSLGSNADANQNAKNFVAWNWKAGTSFSNSAGANGASLASTGSVNTTSGFSIISFAGASAVSTVAHGLGVAPKMIIFKNRSDADAWGVYHESIGSNAALYLNENAGNDGTLWNNTAPTSSVFTVQNNSAVNGSGNNIIAYCFADVQGYSKFGAYSGNGNNNGTFVYTGFKPEFVMVKITNAVNDWIIMDNKRTPFNPMGEELKPNTSGASSTNTRWDQLSNGFKFRNTGDAVNGSGKNYIYMAFGQSIVGTNNVPATAR